MLDFIQQNWNQFIEVVWGQNQFAQGGIVMILAGSAMGLLYKTWGRLSTLTYRLCTVQLSVNSEHNRSYRYLKQWLSVNLNQSKLGSRFLSHNADTILPSYGHHFFLCQRRPMWLYSGLEKEQHVRTEEITLTFVKFWNKRKFIKNIIDEGKILVDKEEYKGAVIRSCNFNGGYYELCTKKTTKPPILESPIKYQQLLDIVHDFRNQEAEYLNKSINYKLGMMFYGEPGNGKTSCILSLANDLQMDITTMSLSSMCESGLLNAVSSLSDREILCIEDIDAIHNRVSKKNSEEDDLISLSTLLNVLDGLYTKHGLIFIISTNFKDKLDPALIRKGRVDHHIEFKNANDYQIKEACNRFDVPYTDNLKQQLINKPMCDISDYLRHKI